ncbi:YcxB family protein [Actinoplanes sp. NPDC026670]|uniref:YcxB family protein n=1 Tax=Actinoplanes sp. NPDC026670 TaxID=3154700 RepID=UPI0033EB2C7F
MHIEFTHARTRAYFRRVLSAGAERKAQPYAIAGATLLAVALLLAVGGEFSGNSLLLAVPLAVLALVPLATAGWHWRRAISVPDSRLAPRTWTLTEESYASRTDGSTTEIAWPDFVSFRATDDAYVLRHRGGATFDIPREPMTAEQDTELGTFLRAA